MGFRVWNLGFKIEGFGLRGVGFKSEGLKPRTWVYRFGAHGLTFRFGDLAVFTENKKKKEIHSAGKVHYEVNRATNSTPS